MPSLRTAITAVVALVALAAVGCPSPSEAIDTTTLPQDARADYEVFAQRCSKCHSLSRPLNSGITDDDYWTLYVARMRRQPGSGISLEDSRVILRFLHYYSLEQIRKSEARKAARLAPGATPSSSSDAGAGDAG
jgi:hypothetical protein